jgi:hypothetical protein
VQYCFLPLWKALAAQENDPDNCGPSISLTYPRLGRSLLEASHHTFEFRIATTNNVDSRRVNVPLPSVFRIFKASISGGPGQATNRARRGRKRSGHPASADAMMGAVVGTSNPASLICLFSSVTKSLKITYE